MTDQTGPVVRTLADAVRTVPGVTRLYPPRRPASAEAVLTTLAGGGAEHGLVLVDGTEATVTIGVTDDVPAPDVAAQVHDLLLAELAAAGTVVTVVHVRIAQID